MKNARSLALGLPLVAWLTWLLPVHRPSRRPQPSADTGPRAGPTSPARPGQRTRPHKGEPLRSGCTASGCHRGIEPIVPPSSGMARAIREVGIEAGDPAGCVVCHGGNPRALRADEAHSGAPSALRSQGGLDRFVRDPGSPWVNAKTCGLCHAELVQAQWRSLMMTEAGKIQGTVWAFGGVARSNPYDHPWANYDVANPKGPRLGTDRYRRYMARKEEAFPNVYPKQQRALPEAPKGDELSGLGRHPSRAAFTYLRAECQRCHLGVRGRAKRGDWRGMGCSACHIPYSNEGFYEGRDPTIPRNTQGHLLVHSIQAGRGAAVRVGSVSYTGIPIETCTTCHNRGKRIGVSFEGLMESPFASPFAPGGRPQVRLHTKVYVPMHADVHARKGMLCQDCHTSADVHGDGHLAATNLAAVEIECTDCHGTPRAYPWELPLGYGDENGTAPARGPARGLARDVPKYLKKGRQFPAEDGYLLTARGNPMPEVVRRGNQVVVHSASGRDLILSPLKLLHEHGSLNEMAETAMVRTARHIDKMECYACHASWAPQCYGCHVKVDYSQHAKSFDWVAAGHKRATDPEAALASREDGFGTFVPGQVAESRSYMRWEDPVLGNNGEGRVTPLIPGCQVSVTLLGPTGHALLRNHIFRSPPGTEGAPGGQITIDMSPVQPHTIGTPRTCESCHSSPKALGYGPDDPDAQPNWSQPFTADLKTGDGRVIPSRTRHQVEPIAGLNHDWSAVVTRDGHQLQTVGHHFPGSGPLTQEQRERMDRVAVCLGCHREIPDGSLAVALLHRAAKTVGALPRTNEQHANLLHRSLLLAGWVEILAGLGAGLLAAALLALWWWKRRKVKLSDS